MFSNIKPYSPVQEREFVWIALYEDGSHLSEYDLLTRNENNFYSIDKSKLVAFGLIGHGHKFYYSAYGGYIHTPFGVIELIYKVEDKEYYLTGQDDLYQDIITYKRANTDIDLINNHSYTQIVEYTYGYKKLLNIDDINFSLRVLNKIPNNEPVHLNIRLVADNELNGSLIIKRNGIIIEEVSAPLNKDVGGEFNWILN